MHATCRCYLRESALRRGTARGAATRTARRNRIPGTEVRASDGTLLEGALSTGTPSVEWVAEAMASGAWGAKVMEAGAVEDFPAVMAVGRHETGLRGSTRSGHWP